MLTLLAAAAASAAIDASSCTALENLQRDTVEVVSSELVPEGPAGRGQSTTVLPEHCRIVLKLKPTDRSDINAELWLPTQDWNGKYLAVGNGGWAGSIQGYNDMQEALIRGYATAGSDNGSSSDEPNGLFALNNPERLTDFAWRALHEMTVTSKSLIETAYSRAPELSYYKGCSTGGRQGLMAAQRYPSDYDGIIAGAPANRHIHMHVAQSWEQMRVNHEPAGSISAEQAALVNRHISEKCDVLDEGFVSNPQQCSVDLAALQCKAGETGSQCLSPAQLETVEIYYGGVTTDDGEVVFAGRPMSVPLTPFEPSAQAPTPFLFDSIRILGFDNPDYDWRQFDLDRDLPMIDEKVGFVDATDPDLADFQAQGGKLLMYHGWNDPGISPRNAIDYFISVLQETDDSPEDWMQLYMVPGMGHCRGGPGPDSFDTLTVLENWREDGTVPAEIPATNNSSGLSRALCPYPLEPIYDGTGAIEAAENWSCSVR